MKLLFAGTPVFAAVVLEALLAHGHQITTVLTQPDRRAGRGLKPQQSAVRQCARRHGIETLQPSRLTAPGVIETLADRAVDAWVVVAYGQLLPPQVLALPPLGCINVHPSLLPRWRGAAPIQRALLAGDSATGVTLMRMDEGMDTGPILAMANCPIEPRDTAAALHDRLADLGAHLLLEQLPAVADGTLTLLPQEESLATYAPRLSKPAARIDWGESASVIDRQVRGMNPWPVAHTQWHRDNNPSQRLRIWAAAAIAADSACAPGTVLASDANGIVVRCGQGGLRLLTLQAPGAGPLPVGDYLRGHPLPPGQMFG